MSSRPGHQLEWIGAPPRVRLTWRTRLRGDVAIRRGISPIEPRDYDPSDLPWTVHSQDEGG